MAFCFAILPQVRVPANRELRLSPYILWRNDTAEWVKRSGADNTAFLSMYRDESGNAVGPNATVLTRADYGDATYDDFRDAVYCLSTAAWLRGLPASDAWVFERWRVPVPMPNDELFRRGSKFSTNITSADVDRVYPTPYTYRVDLTLQDQEVLDWLAQEFDKRREESILTALGHFHLARFDTPYFTSPGDDIEAMWSGFESLLEIDRYGRKHSGASATRCERVIRRIRIFVSATRRLRVGKQEKLRRALRAELGEYAGWRSETWEGIDKWSKQFYSERNHHSHGARAELDAKYVEPYGLSAYEIAIHIARGLLDLRWRGDNFFLASSVAERLNTLFLLGPITQRVAAILGRYDRKSWYPGTGAEGAAVTGAELDSLTRDLRELVALESASRQFAEDKSVDRARHKMGLVLSAWVKDLLARAPAHITLSPVDAVPGTIAGLVQQKKTRAQIDTQVALLLENTQADNLEPYGVGEMEPLLRLRGRIPIWVWIGAYIKLTHLWLGPSTR